MAALDSSTNPLVAGLKKEINILVWQLWDMCKNESVPIRISILKIPITVNVPVPNLSDLIKLLVGPEVVVNSSTSPN